MSPSLNWNLTLLLVFGSPLLLLNSSSGLRCYECGGAVASEKITCSNFESSSKVSYIKECPPETHSCSIQQSGNIVTRSCENIQLDDCKTANNIEYCYCSRDLCNDVFVVNNVSDDEDLFEGSGVRITTTEITTNNVNVIDRKYDLSSDASNYILVTMRYYCIIILMFIIYVI